MQLTWQEKREEEYLVQKFTHITHLSTLEPFAFMHWVRSRDIQIPDFEPDSIKAILRFGPKGSQIEAFEALRVWLGIRQIREKLNG